VVVVVSKPRDADQRALMRVKLGEAGVAGYRVVDGLDCRAHPPCAQQLVALARAVREETKANYTQVSPESRPAPAPAPYGPAAACAVRRRSVWTGGVAHCYGEDFEFRTQSLLHALPSSARSAAGSPLSRPLTPRSFHGRGHTPSDTDSPLDGPVCCIPYQMPQSFGPNIGSCRVSGLFM
jgi:hypothetical protein